MPILRPHSVQFHERHISSVTFTLVHLYGMFTCRWAWPHARQFVRFWASGGAKFPKMKDSLLWTMMNRGAKKDAVSFMLGGEIRNRTNKHIHSNCYRYILSAKEFRFNVSLNTESVILETFFPTNVLAWYVSLVKSQNGQLKLVSGDSVADLKSQDGSDSEVGKMVFVLRQDLGTQCRACNVHQVFTELGCIITASTQQTWLHRHCINTTVCLWITHHLRYTNSSRQTQLCQLLNFHSSITSSPVAFSFSWQLHYDQYIFSNNNNN